MRNNIFIALVLIAALVFSAIAFAQGAGAPPSPPASPTPPSGPTGGAGTPPSGPSAGTGTPPPTPTPPAMGDENRPLKERLEAFYAKKENFINQKRQCKEEVVITNAPKGTCWSRLKPMMLGLLLKEVTLTEKRLVQLQDKNITFPNRAEIDAKLAGAKAIFSDSGSSKELLKSTAKSVEELINQIEETATWNQADLLITQMDDIMVRADALVSKLDAKLSELRAAGNDVGQLEIALTQFKADLAKTKESIANAKAKYAEMGSAEEISQLAKEVRTFINNAKNYLEKAFDKAKKIVPAMDKSEKGGSINSSDLTIDGTGGGAS